jgi:hypothetical protein
MKSNKIYKIEFSQFIEQEDLQSPLFGDLSNCLDYEDQKYVGFSNNDDMFLRLPDYKISLILEVLEKHNFKFQIFDITTDVINGKTQKEFPEVEQLTPFIFEHFRFENTSVDDVLDKIIESGIDSIDEIDKKILNS